MTSPSYTNLTSLSTTTRYLTEEVRNLCRLMERRLSLADEKFDRFEDRQKRQQEEFFNKITKSDIKINKEVGEKKERRSENGNGN